MPLCTVAVRLSGFANPERRTRKAVSKGYADTKLTRDSSYSGEGERPTEPRSVE
jgi:hypothetical protein